ncbi:hypothetical protein [Acinetobacter rongchengensis]|uniref:Uncharacterized protein n=1 Tax=Acinetobacter rongchengensis TaxID=2419601 RepID=A0A3A8F3A2_9GAMM|nr:hypothetical protein [Acinetobacter rongchengensis]RKG40878.1 hypothetical protein D7V20_00360 [Acinetobacter rongchengensis]
MIPQFNYRYCENQDRSQSKKVSVFTQPGYEGYSSQNNRYKTHDLAKLLPWSEQVELVIDARLRFDPEYCLFASFDDEQIKQFNSDFFHLLESNYFLIIKSMHV